MIKLVMTVPGTLSTYFKFYIQVRCYVLRTHEFNVQELPVL